MILAIDYFISLSVDMEIELTEADAKCDFDRK